MCAVAVVCVHVPVVKPLYKIFKGRHSPLDAGSPSPEAAHQMHCLCVSGATSQSVLPDCV